MKSFLFFFAVFASACQISQKAETSGISNQANSNRPANVVSNEGGKTQNVKTVDASRFESVKIKRTDGKNKFSLKIDVEYPQIKNAKNARESKLNQHIKKRVDEQMLDFTKYLTNKEKDVTEKVKGDYELNLTYEIDYFSENFASILMNWNGFSGYLNYDYFPSTINFDLRNGKSVKLKDLFEPTAKYLEKLSEASRNILRKTCLSCGCGAEIKAGDPLPEAMIPKEEDSENSKNLMSGSSWYFGGTEPLEENFSNWSIAANGLKITFGEYQVGPGCIGIIDITIPFQDLQPILKSDLNFD